MDLKKVWNCGFSNKKVNEFGQSTPLCVARISISKVKIRCWQGQGYPKDRDGLSTDSVCCSVWNRPLYISGAPAMTAVEEHKCLVLHMLKTKSNGVFSRWCWYPAKEVAGYLRFALMYPSWTLLYHLFFFLIHNQYWSFLQPTTAFLYKFVPPKFLNPTVLNIHEL